MLSAMQAEPTPPSGPGIDIGQIVNGIVNGLLNGLGDALTAWVNTLPLMAGDNAVRQGQNLIDGLWRSPYNFMTRIPAELTSQQSDVQSLSHQLQGAQIAVMALLVVIAGYRLMFSHDSMTETAIKFGISVTAAAAFGWWSEQAFGLANALSDGIGWPSTFNLPLEGVLSNLALIVLFLVVVLFAVKAFLKGGATILLIDVLLVVGPLVLLLWMIPQTQKWASWWIDQFVAAVISRPATAIIFRVGFGIVFSVGDPFVALILGGSAFWLATEMSDRIAGNLSVSGGVASLARVAVMQRAVGMAAGGIGAAGAMAGRLATAIW